MVSLARVTPRRRRDADRHLYLYARSLPSQTSPHAATSMLFQAKQPGKSTAELNCKRCDGPFATATDLMYHNICAHEDVCETTSRSR